MPKKLLKYIESKSNVLGGTPVVVGTRIPVERIYQLIKQGNSVENIQADYPWVDRKKIQYTIAYLVKAGLDEFEKTQKIQASIR